MSYFLYDYLLYMSYYFYDSSILNMRYYLYDYLLNTSYYLFDISDFIYVYILIKRYVLSLWLCNKYYLLFQTVSNLIQFFPKIHPCLPW